MITSLSPHITNRIGDNLHKQAADQDSRTTTERMTLSHAKQLIIITNYSLLITN